MQCTIPNTIVCLCRSTRNPYNATKIAGGSSSGSAAVVCAGLCPVALGVDGGGTCGGHAIVDLLRRFFFSFNVQ
jgi:hypothetical protein